ncbi:Cytochrome c [Pirellula sp. SH-Sr6A]|uniref:c-type cytochrome n=1 Tax=Pirellula sp. SH-Sr6A TaxID=1632865 RepID=UPI00078CF72A|nr:c-type cytochrome [Pirellula sp. SH-Sr6A]AMV32867.1 Cytochrome c [Pirellula sp. SH-Sr6A]
MGIPTAKFNRRAPALVPSHPFVVDADCRSQVCCADSAHGFVRPCVVWIPVVRQYVARIRSRCAVDSSLMWKASLLGIFLLVGFAGCSEPRFVPNELAAAGYLQSVHPGDVEPLASEASAQVLTLFGTPDAPKWPSELAPIVDMEEVARSAGPVGRAYDKVERGLYRKHCVQCHGISGDGLGPAASLLAPYPRDFRRGTYKFKSTPIGSKPTKADLVHVLERGIPGTSMPSFAPLRNREEFATDIEALVEYVIYLSVRGEVERRLLRIAANDESEVSEETALAEAQKVVSAWKEAPESIPAPIDVPELSAAELTASIDRGSELFRSEKTACYRCHGNDGKGDGISQDYDEWTKDWTIRAGIDPANKTEWKLMKPFGALKPVVNRSRNLHLGALRGGDRIEDLARRIQLGIDGTPMPAATVAEDSPNVLNVDEFRDLVRFVFAISHNDANTSSEDSEPAEVKEVQHGK